MTTNRASVVSPSVMVHTQIYTGTRAPVMLIFIFVLVCLIVYFSELHYTLTYPLIFNSNILYILIFIQIQSLFLVLWKIYCTWFGRSDDAIWFVLTIYTCKIIAFSPIQLYVVNDLIRDSSDSTSTFMIWCCSPPPHNVNLWKWG